MGNGAKEVVQRSPTQSVEQAAIAGVMRDLFERVTWVIFTLGLVSVTATVLRGGEHGLSVSSWLDVGIYVSAAVLLLLRRRIAPHTLFWAIISLIWLDGAISLAMLGLASAGLFILCAASAMIGIFYGLRAGLLAVAAVVGLVAALGGASAVGLLEGAPDPGRLVTAPGTWVVQGATFAFYTVSVIFAAYGMQSRLGQALSSLEERSTELERTNRQLEREVASREQSERELGESEEKFRRLAHNSPDVVFLHSVMGKIEYMNPAAARVFGYSKEEAIGLDCRELMKPSSRARADGAFAAALARTSTGETELPLAEFEYLRKDGSSFWGEIQASLILDAAGRPAHVQGIIRDVTERRAIEEARRELEARLSQTEKLQAIGQLAGGVAHDFNNQLSAITGFATLLMRSDALPTALRPHAEGILAAARRSADLTSKLLAFARRDPVTRDPVDMHQVVEDVMAMLEVGCDKRIEIRHHMAAEAHLVLGDRSQLVSVLLNLGLNARDAMSDGGKLSFCSENDDVEAGSERAAALHLTPGRHLVIAVTDTGVGMDPELAKRVFEPFFTTKPPGAGTGMGLAAAYGTLKAHHGGIELETAKGVGSTFRVFLPLSQGSTRPQALEPAVPVARGAGAVLVIDDEPAVASVCAELLGELGYTSVSYTTARAGLAHFRDHKDEVDLVVLDMVMPDLDGREVFRSLRELDPGVRVLLTSGYSWQTSARALLAQGAVGFMQKPYSFEDLSTAVASALARPRPS